MRKSFISYILVGFLCLTLHAQPVIQGVWQGILLKDGVPLDKAIVVYADFKIKEGILSGKIRNEVGQSDYFAVKQVKGKSTKNEINFEEFVIEKKKSNPQMNWCTIEGTMKYSDTTGYLEGRFTSKSCRNYNGKIILFRSSVEFKTSEEKIMDHAWVKGFISDYKMGFFAPEIREKERLSFVFQPIYFDYDRAEIRAEYEPYLNKIIRVVNGHTDLRIRVIGNTDSDGSANYNIDLSKKRAQALIDYFTQHGMNNNKIIIDFKGEDNPIDSNSTPEGKQKNRRVDFRFD